MNSKCTDCGEEMQLQSAPDIKASLRIPFTDYELQLWDWGNMEYMCIDCMTDNHDAPYRDAYEQGCQDGFMEGIEKAQSEERAFRELT